MSDMKLEITSTPEQEVYEQYKGTYVNDYSYYVNLRNDAYINFGRTLTLKNGVEWYMSAFIDIVNPNLELLAKVTDGYRLLWIEDDVFYFQDYDQVRQIPTGVKPSEQYLGFYEFLNGSDGMGGAQLTIHLNGTLIGTTPVTPSSVAVYEAQVSAFAPRYRTPETMKGGSLYTLDMGEGFGGTGGGVSIRCRATDIYDTLNSVTVGIGGSSGNTTIVGMDLGRILSPTNDYTVWRGVTPTATKIRPVDTFVSSANTYITFLVVEGPPVEWGAFIYTNEVLNRGFFLPTGAQTNPTPATIPAIPPHMDIVLDSTGNIKFTQTFAELVAQRIQCRLSTFMGEWFLDRSLGVPFFEEVFKVAPDVNRVRNLLLSEAVTVPGVKEITSFVARFDNETRTFSLQFSALCTDGTTAEGEI